MWKFILIGILGTSLAVTILPAKTLTLEDGSIIYVKEVTSSELKDTEAQLGCSVKCASACLSFSQGLAAVQCTKHCGCDSLLLSADPSVASLSSASKLLVEDIKIDIVLPDSDTDTTDIYVEVADGEDFTVSISEDSYSYNDEEYGYTYETVTANVNTENGSDTEDEMTVSNTYYDDGTTTYDYATYSDAQGGYASAEAYESVVTDENTTVTYDYASVSDGYNTNYVESTTTTTSGDGYVEETVEGSGSVQGYGYTDSKSTVYYGDESSGYGETTESFSWWVNAQQYLSDSFEGLGLIAWAIIALSIAAIGVLAYNKFSQVKARRYQVNVKAVNEDATGYIRI